MTHLPYWLKQDIPDARAHALSRELAESNVDTVCRQAHCPNMSGCFKNKELTFMVLGPVCSRHCRFCAVKKAEALAALSVDETEPDRLSRAAQKLGLDYVVITSVTRDDLPDLGSGQFVRAIEAIQAIDQNIEIEVLIPDFKADAACIRAVLDAKPSVVGHNLETVRPLFGFLKPDSDYDVSLTVLQKVKEISPDAVTKSSLLLGLGETFDEVALALKELRQAQCDIVVLGQYLAPSPDHYPVKEFVTPERFKKYRQLASDLGFKGVLSEPLARSSYKAKELYMYISPRPLLTNA